MASIMNSINLHRDLEKGQVLTRLTLDELRYGKIVNEEGRLHIHCFDEVPLIGTEKVYQYDVIESMLQQPITAFLEFRWSQSIGRVYIRLIKDSLRARQFALLCTGEYGPSYKGSKLLGVLNKGSPYECIRGGDYELNDGEGGLGIVKDAEMEDIKSDIKTGNVWGWMEDKKRCAQFGISVSDGLGGNLMHCLGFVIQGLEVCKKMIEENVREGNQFQNARVTDCGIVLNWD